MNEALRLAMTEAGVNEHELSQRCGVDARTVGRWITNSARMPRPDHRRTICGVLGVQEADLWPSAVRANVKTGAGREIVQVFPYRSQAPASLWRNLIRGAESEITFAGYTNYFFWLEHPHLVETLRRKASNGCRVRFVIGDPDSPVTRDREREEDAKLTLSTRIAVTVGELEKLRDVTNVEARYATGHVNFSVFRFDTDLVATPILARHVGHNSPMFHVRREQSDGMFDRFTEHVEALWSQGRDIWEVFDRGAA